MVEAEDGISGKLLADLRRDRMVELVDQRGQMTSDELAQAFDVSPMTVWRDLASLESAGRLRRVRGGVVRVVRVDRRADAEPLFVSKQVVNRDRSVSHTLRSRGAQRNATRHCANGRQRNVRELTMGA